jgi:hypothetical protein
MVTLLVGQTWALACGVVRVWDGVLCAIVAIMAG